MKIGVAKNKKKIFVSLYKKNIELHPLWLRERVNNRELLDKNTGQRLYDPSELNHKLKIKRALTRKGMTKNVLLKIIRNQLSDTYNKKKADFVINTSKTKNHSFKMILTKINNIMDKYA